MKTKRFAYEKAERILDEYAGDKSRSAQFRRTYKKFKWAIYGIAHVDFGHGDHPDEVNLAHAWEDVEVAFAGYGEPVLTGCILQLWSHTPKTEMNQFERAVRKAFEAANEATGDDVPRRYLSAWRRKPIRRPEQGFNLPTVLPTYGPRLRDWALDEKEDAAAIEEQLYWLEMADREILKSGSREVKVEEPRGKGPFLQLLPDPETTEEKPK